ncbi:MAG: methyltransferase type 12 [Desulfuromonadaceae bacterium]|nr:methyltransferase type 12 [Desulfuromonadaceae bacterium]
MIRISVKPLGAQMTDQLAFIAEFVKHPLQVGSIIPSSHFLLRRIVDAAGIDSAKTIVELGPGNGGSTRAILRAAPANMKLLSVEVNPSLHALVRDIGDKRLIAHRGDACHLKEILAQYGLGAPDVVISGIPFSTMSVSTGSQLLKEISSLLAPGGRFVAYQVSRRVATLARPFMGTGHMELELFNIPPMRVYRWEKR